MSWARTDDDFPEHVKIDALERLCGSWQAYAAARTVWHDLLCDCARRRTDGAFDRARAHRVVRLPPEVVDEALGHLVAVRLFEEAGADGWVFHDWTDYQPSKAELDEERKAGARRQAEWRKRQRAARAERERNAVTNAVTNPVTNGVTDGVTNAVSHAQRSPETVSADPRNAPPTHPIPSQEREGERARTPEVEARCGTEERPNAPQPEEVEATLVRAGGCKLDLRTAAGVKVHLRRAFVELGYPLAAWKALGEQIGADPAALWPSDFMRSLLARSGGKVTVSFLLGKKLDAPPAGACGYDCAPLTEAFGRLAHLRAQAPAQRPAPPSPRPAPPPPSPEPSRATVAAIAAIHREALASAEVARG